jgi:hypothetical protein
VDAQVAHKPAAGEPGRHQQGQKQCGLGARVVPGDLDEEDQGAERDQQQRDHAVEAAGFGVRPGVERPDDLAAAVGVGAVRLASGGRATRPGTCGFPAARLGILPMRGRAVAVIDRGRRKRLHVWHVYRRLSR